MLAAFIKLFDTQHLIHKDLRTDQSLPSTEDLLKRILRVAWPAIVEAVLVSIVSIADTMMIGVLGYEAIAAVGLTTQPRMIVLAFFMSLNVGITAVVARRRGSNDRDKANRSLAQALTISIVVALVISVVAVIFSRQILLFAGAAPDTIDLAQDYFEIIIGGIVFNIISMAITAAQRGVGNTRLSMYTNLTANLVNIVFNWLLIEGNLGFPRLEGRGAAIATTLGYFVASIMAIVSVLQKDGFLHLQFKNMLRLQKEILSPLFQVGLSAGVEQVFMRVGFFLIARMVATLGTVAFAAHQICINILNVSFAFGDGLGSASSSLMGQSLGEKRPDKAVCYGSIARRLGLMLAVVLSALFLIFRRAIILPFSTEAQVIDLCSTVMLFIAALVPIQITQVIYSQGLRVAGDTRYVAATSLVSIAVIRTVSAYVLAFVCHMGLIGIWCGFVIDQFVRMVSHRVRFRTGKWAYKSL